MGGNAFRGKLSTALFPRMSPHTYQALRARLLPLVQSQFESVAVPREAPEKVDHGDLDFVVTRPRPGTSPSTVQKVLRATHSIPQEGNRTSNYAIPANAFDLGAEWERILFLHSYGDTGMIFGVLARMAGLSLNVHGLKVRLLIPRTTFHLTSSLQDILAFYGLSKSRWNEAFETQRDVFEWVAMSPLFDAQRIVPSDRTHDRGRKARGARSMFQNFLDFAQERAVAASLDGNASPSAKPRITQDDALRFFGKEAERAALLRASAIKEHARAKFSGSFMEKCTGMQGLSVKWLMDAIRERLVEGYVRQRGVTQGQPTDQTTGPFTVSVWELALFEMSKADVASFALQVKAEMEAAGTFEAKWAEENARKAQKQMPK
ncbi:hypothetical protein POSPLADRAFT_1149832 [Postia placenta MAD-698-R-SB12]|uniref:Uncharacterized protein n=1 Tax=Postia placenta MAD-698-R-SB12 TaxID=670580 RepID=A0A1X6MUE4_9APHY|nr:hypothetical protein POSPLADRAFT_1149832 [Postia placenta MAD-698-R-SB12]OSX59813.1 hypothetical protein POSPLADRAFT_1149832 [Postia placenta MAD-698-R-SB12]